MNSVELFSRREVEMDCRVAIQEIRGMFGIAPTTEWHFVGMLEAVLQVYHEDYLKFNSKPQAHELDETVRMFGIYLGEMMRLRAGRGEWKLLRSEYGRRIVLDLGYELDPIERVRRRILEGERFDVISYAQNGLTSAC